MKRASSACSGTVLFLVLALGTPATAPAQNAAYQAFFSGVCTGAPSGALATRCGETPGGTGDLSDDSEDSLNPSQFVSSNEAALVRARRRAREVREYVEQRRSEDAPDSALSLLVNGRSTWFDRDRTDAERGFDGTVRGVQVGGDYRLGEAAILGAFLGYARGDSEFDSDSPGVAFTPLSNEGSTNSETWSLTLFGSTSLSESVFADASISYGLTDYEFKRRAVFQESGRAIPQTNVSARATPDGGEFTSDIGLTYETLLAGFTLGTYVRGTYARTWIESHREEDRTGSGLAASVDRQTRDSVTGTLGVRARTAWNTSFGVLVPQARLEYQHEFDRDEQEADTRLLLDAAGAVFSLEGEDPDEDYAEAGLGLALVLPNGWMYFIDGQALLGHADLSRYTLALGLRKEF